MKQLPYYFYLSVILILILVFPRITHAGEFNLFAEPLNFNITTPANIANKASINIFSPYVEHLTIYPFAFDWKLTKEKFNYEISSWFKFANKSITLTESKDYPVNFSVTAPSGTQVGEYFKVIALSNQPFSCIPSDNPPVMLGIPATIQVIQGIPITSSGGTNNETGLFSKLKITELDTSFNLLNQTQKVKFNVINEGNISSIPYGKVNIRSTQGNIIETFSINPQSLAIPPGESYIFSYNFKSNDFLLGYLGAEVNLGYKNSQIDVPLSSSETVRFIYISNKVIYSVALSILIALIIEKILSIPLRLRVKYLRYYVIIVTVLPLLFLIHLTIPLRYSQTLGVTTQLPPESQSMEVSAAVKDTLSLKVDKTAKFAEVTADTQKGWKLWSLRCKWPYPIAQNDNGNNYPVRVSLSDDELMNPLLLVPKVYFPNFYY